MPNYSFICNKCEHKFDELLSVNDREGPLKKKCPSCNKKGGVKRDFNDYSQTIGSDTTLTPNNATGGRWNELMGRMKKGIAKRYHKNLDSATSRTGRYWSG
jgi:putative FmdB family regulatory protein